VKWYSFILVLLCAGLVSAGVMGVLLGVQWVLIDTSSVNSSSEFDCVTGTERFFSSVDGEVLESCQDNAIVYTAESDANVLRVIVNELASSDICLVYGVVGSQERLLAVGSHDFEGVSSGDKVCFKWRKEGSGLCQVDFDLNKS